MKALCDLSVTGNGGLVKVFRERNVQWVKACFIEACLGNPEQKFPRPNVLTW